MNEIIRAVLIDPIGNLFVFFYSVSGSSFVVGIMLTTLFTKIILFPLYRQQLESPLKLKKIKPRLEKINKKYEKNPTKRQEETMKLYKEVDYQPLGCFTSILVQFPIIIALFNVISNISKGQSTYVYSFLRNFLNFGEEWKINLYNIGINWGESAKNLYQKTGFSGETFLFIGVIALVVLLQIFSTYISYTISGDDPKKEEKPTKKAKKEEQDPLKAMMGNQKQFMIINSVVMSFMIANFAWGMPLGLSLYWIFQTLFHTIEQMVFTKYIYKDHK